MDSKEFVDACVKMVVTDVNDRLLPESVFRISDADVYVVWLCEVLQNNKAILSTKVPDGTLYEITYNGDKKEFYLDTYVKQKNVCYHV